MGWKEIQTYIKVGAMSSYPSAFLEKSFNENASGREAGKQLSQTIDSE
jgi:hypothetical protein